MRNRITIIGVFVALFAAACGGGSSTPPPPIDAAVDAFQSNCGHPGDQGNELGIGKFCGSFSDCSNTTGAPLCSSIGDSTTHFCTKTCTKNSTTECGAGTFAMCTCNGSNQCGCTPTTCL